MIKLKITKRYDGWICTHRDRDYYNHKHSSWFWAQNFGNNGSACKPNSTKRLRNIDKRLNVSFGTSSKSLLSLGSDHSLSNVNVVWLILKEKFCDKRTINDWQINVFTVQRMRQFLAKYEHPHYFRQLVLSINMLRHLVPDCASKWYSKNAEKMW